jgi:hypothetical protein
LNTAQAALGEIEFGFAPLLVEDEAKIVIEVEDGAEIGRLTYRRQPADPAAWPTVDSFVSAYATRQVLRGLPQVRRVMLGSFSVSASVENAAEHIEHVATWVTFRDGSRAIVDLTPLATNFAARHMPDQMMTDSAQIEEIFADRREGVYLDQLQPMTTVEEDGELYYLLARVLIAYDRYTFSLRIHPVQMADPMNPMNLRPGATAGIEIDRTEFEKLQTLVADAGPPAFNQMPELLVRRGGNNNEALTSVLDDNLHLLWHLVTKFEHEPPDPAAGPTPTPTSTPMPTPTPTPTPTATPRKLPLLTS